MRRSTTDRNALAEIRQSYLLRQSSTGNRHKNFKNPYFNIKPDHYDYRFSDFRNYFVPERPALPYYVVPVLYVPQKVLTANEMEQRRTVSRKNEMSQTVESNYEYHEEEANADLDNLGSKSHSYTRRTNSESTVEVSSISSQFEDDPLKNDYLNNYNKEFESKYPINEDVLRGETCNFDSKQRNSALNTREQQKNTFWKYKNPYTIFNKYPLTPNDNKISSHEECIENNPLEFEELNDKRKQKICIDCLKDKYLNKDCQCRKSSKNLQTNFEVGEVDVFEDTDYRKVFGCGTKATQTLSATKINSGTQTEVEEKLTYRKMKGSQIPQRTNGLKVSYTELVKRNGYGNTNNIRKKSGEV